MWQYIARILLVSQSHVFVSPAGLSVDNQPTQTAGLPLCRASRHAARCTIASAKIPIWRHERGCASCPSPSPVRFGYRPLSVLIPREGRSLGKDHTCRLYAERSLRLYSKRPRRTIWDLVFVLDPVPLTDELERGLGLSNVRWLGLAGLTYQAASLCSGRRPCVPANTSTRLIVTYKAVSRWMWLRVRLSCPYWMP